MLTFGGDSDALRLTPNSPEVLALRGLVLFLSGKLAQALQHAQSALRLDPSYEPAQRLRRRVKDVEKLKGLVLRNPVSCVDGLFVLFVSDGGRMTSCCGVFWGGLGDLET